MFGRSLQPFEPLTIPLTWNQVLESTLYAPGDSDANMMFHTRVYYEIEAEKYLWSKNVKQLHFSFIFSVISYPFDSMLF